MSQKHRPIRIWHVDGPHQELTEAFGEKLSAFLKATRNDPRFSPNLSKWIAKHGYVRVYFLTVKRSFINGSVDITEQPVDLTDKQRLIFGHDNGDGWLSGNRLPQIFCNGSRAEAWANVAMTNQGEKWQEVTLEFWEAYMQGRCAIDPDHTYWDQRDRWDEKGDFRTCLWCGLKQNRETKKVRVTKTIHTWHSVKSEVPNDHQ